NLPMTDRRAALASLLASALAPWPLCAARAQAAPTAIRMGIQIFTGAVATVWYEKRIFEKRGLAVEAKQMADGRSVRDAMVAGQLNVGTMNITPFIVGPAAGGLVMAGAGVARGGDR